SAEPARHIANDQPRPDSHRAPYWSMRARKGSTSTPAGQAPLDRRAYDGNERGDDEVADRSRDVSLHGLECRGRQLLAYPGQLRHGDHRDQRRVLHDDGDLIDERRKNPLQQLRYDDAATGLP